jgi:hypothetical protein
MDREISWPIAAQKNTRISIQTRGPNNGFHFSILVFVIEEDCKTEEEFIEGLAEMQVTLEALDTKATELSSVARHNVKQLIGDE